MNADSLLNLAVRAVDAADRALRRARPAPPEPDDGPTDQPPPGTAWHQREARVLGDLAARTKEHGPWAAAHDMTWTT